MNKHQKFCHCTLSGTIILIVLIALQSFAIRQQAWALPFSLTEFEGTMSLSRYIVSADGSEEKVSGIDLRIHPDYMLLVSTEGSAIDLVGNIRAESVLIRQNRDDIVFLTTDEKAVTMDRQELQQMINMLENMRGNSGNRPSDNEHPDVRETDETETIQGFEAHKWVVSPDDGSTEWHVWITGDISVPWGMLSQRWLLRHTLLEGLPAEEWLNEGKLPVKAEFINRDRLAEVIRFENISQGNVSEADFRIPANYQQINFQQMLFDRMRNR